MLTRWRVLTAAVLMVAAPATAWAARGYVTDSVNLRAGPGTEYPIVDTIPDGARLTIHGCLSDADWCDVTWSSDRGWVSANYLDYFYNNRYVYLPDYVDVIDVPVATFTLGSYWGHYYTGRPWYHRLHHWQQVWRHQGRYGHWREGHHRFAHGGRHHHIIAGVNRGPHLRTGGVSRRHGIAGMGSHRLAAGRRNASHLRHNFANRRRAPNMAGHHMHRNFAVPRGGPRFAGHRGAGRFAAHGGAPGMHFHNGGHGLSARGQAIGPRGGGGHMGGHMGHMGGAGPVHIGGGGHMGGHIGGGGGHMGPHGGARHH